MIHINNNLFIKYALFTYLCKILFSILSSTTINIILFTVYILIFYSCKLLFVIIIFVTWYIILFIISILFVYLCGIMFFTFKFVIWYVNNYVIKKYYNVNIIFAETLFGLNVGFKLVLFLSLVILYWLHEKLKKMKQ